MSRADRADRAKQELYNFQKQLSELWEKAGDLWLKTTENDRARECYEKAATFIEKACLIIGEQTEIREAFVDATIQKALGLNEVEGEGDEPNER